MDARKYRATHYAYKHWQIEEFITPGKDAKDKEPYWRIIKYPGDLQNAVSGLLDLHMDGFTIEAVNDARTAINSAEKRIIDNLNALFVERNNEDK